MFLDAEISEVYESELLAPNPLPMLNQLYAEKANGLAPKKQQWFRVFDPMKLSQDDGTRGKYQTKTPARRALSEWLAQQRHIKTTEMRNDRRQQGCCFQCGATRDSDNVTYCRRCLTRRNELRRLRAAKGSASRSTQPTSHTGNDRVRSSFTHGPKYRQGEVLGRPKIKAIRVASARGGRYLIVPSKDRLKA